MKEFFTAVLTFITNPIQIGLVIVIGFCSTTLLSMGIFIPEDLLIKYNLNTFFINNFSNILIVFLFSLFMFITQMVSIIYKNYELRRDARQIKKNRKILLKDPVCWEFLLKVYEGKGQPVNLPFRNQKVIQLESNYMITRTTDQIFMRGYDVSNPMFPYILQPWAEDYIKKITDNSTKNKK